MEHERQQEAHRAEMLRLEAYLKQCSKINKHYLRFLQNDSPYYDYFTRQGEVARRAQVLIQLRKKTPVRDDVPLCIV